MPSLSTVLKAEIVRLARKELKGELAHLRKQVSAHRAAIAGLRRQVANVERLAKRGVRMAPKTTIKGESTTALRFSAKGVKALRAKMGLSAADFGRLAGVTGTTVFNWEAEKARPQRAQLEALHGLRGMGKRAAWAKLDEMDA